MVSLKPLAVIPLQTSRMLTGERYVQLKKERRVWCKTLAAGNAVVLGQLVPVFSCTIAVFQAGPSNRLLNLSTFFEG